MGMYGDSIAYFNRYKSNGYVLPRQGKAIPMARVPLARTPIVFAAPAHHCCGGGIKPLAAFLSGGIGFGLGALFGWLTRRNQPAVSYAPQGGMGGYGNYGGYGTQPAANGLQNLQYLYGSKYNIVQNADGTYTVATKDGQTKLEKATYDQVVSAMKGDNSSAPAESVKPEETEDPSKTEKPEETEDPSKTEKPEETEEPSKTEKPEETEEPSKTEKPEETEEPGKTEKPEETEDPSKTEKPEETDSNGKTNKKNSHTVVAGDNLWNIAKQHLTEKNGTAPTNAEILAETKRLMEVNGLKYSDGNNSMVLIRPGDVIKYGDSTEEVSEDSNKVPEDNNENSTSAKGNIEDSIYTAENGDFITKGKDGKLQYFDKDGNPMSEKEFKGAHNTINTTEIQNGGYSSKGTRVQSKSGRWAEKNGDTWNFYAKDGTNLKPEYVQQVDPELWQKTWQGVPYEKPEAAKEEYKPYDWNSMPRAQWDIEKGWH